MIRKRANILRESPWSKASLGNKELVKRHSFKKVHGVRSICSVQLGQFSRHPVDPDRFQPRWRLFLPPREWNGETNCQWQAWIMLISGHFEYSCTFFLLFFLVELFVLTMPPSHCLIAFYWRRRTRHRRTRWDVIFAHFWVGSPSFCQPILPLLCEFCSSNEHEWQRASFSCHCWLLSPKQERKNVAAHKPNDFCGNFHEGPLGFERITKLQHRLC